MKKVEAYDVVDHGIEHFQYFQGCGIALTDFDHVVTGIGDNPAEAFEDCLEYIAQDGFDAADLRSRILDDEEWESFPTAPSVSDKYPDDDETSELYYHVSIRWK